VEVLVRRHTGSCWEERRGGDTTAADERDEKTGRVWMDGVGISDE
jgi:hypothetical protein